MSDLIKGLEGNLKESIKEVVGITFGDSPDFIDPDGSAKGLSSIIAISDGLSGYLAIHMSPESACAIAGTMLGDSYPEVDDIVCDAVGELTNMMGGSLKKFSGRFGEPFKISVPTIVRGKDYETHAAKDAEQALLGVSLGVNTVATCFTVQLVIYAR